MSNMFSRGEMILGSEGMRKLKKSHVAVFGLGGVGSWCAEALVRSGVGKLTLVDHDTVSESNTNRQACASSKTVGQPKTEAMAQRLFDINPDVKINLISARYEAAARARFFPPEQSWDYIVDAIDLVSCKIDLIETSMKLKIPIISAMGAGNKLDAQQMKICDISKTYGCPLARVVRRELRNRGILHHQIVFSAEEIADCVPLGEEDLPQGRRSVPGSVMWVTATAGLLLAQHVITELIRE